MTLDQAQGGARPTPGCKVGQHHPAELQRAGEPGAGQQARQRASQLAAGAKVNLVVSNSHVKVPDVTGNDPATASTILIQAGFNPVIRTLPRSTPGHERRADRQPDPGRQDLRRDRIDRLHLRRQEGAEADAARPKLDRRPRHQPPRPTAPQPRAPGQATLDRVVLTSQIKATAMRWRSTRSASSGTQSRAASGRRTRRASSRASGGRPGSAPTRGGTARPRPAGRGGAAP